MKKKIAILLAALLCMAWLPMTTSAAETTEMVPVVAQVPADWEAPHLWAWHSGGNVFDAWPGGAMESLGDGWYYVYVPACTENIIVNANGGSVQTADLAVEAGKAVWVTVAEDKTATLSYDALTGEVPAYVEKFVVHASVPASWETVNMWAWSDDGVNAFSAWPGEAMEASDDGWYTGEVPNFVNNLIINGNGGSVQTADVKIEAKELWFTVNDDLTYEVVYEKPVVKDTVTVHAQVPADWSDPCCWAWSNDGVNAFSAWPGEALTVDGDWYVIEVPNWIANVIINGNGGSVQTADLAVESGKELWVVVAAADNATVTYAEPTGEAAPEETPVVDEPTVDTPDAPVVGGNDGGDQDGGNTGLIIGIVAAVVVIAGGAFVVVKKKKK